MPDERTRKQGRSFVDLSHSLKREDYEHHLIKSAQIVRDALGFREGSIFYQASTARTDTLTDQPMTPLSTSLPNPSIGEQASDINKSLNSIFEESNRISKPFIKMTPDEIQQTLGKEACQVVPSVGESSSSSILPSVPDTPIEQHSTRHTPLTIHPPYHSLRKQSQVSLTDAVPKQPLVLGQITHPCSGADRLLLSFVPQKKYVLGEGRYCQVYKGLYSMQEGSSLRIQPSLESMKVCAVKRMHPNAEAQAIGLSEMFVLRRISPLHENIIKLIGSKDDTDVNSLTTRTRLSFLATSPLTPHSPISSTRHITPMDPTPRLMLLLEYAQGTVWDFMINTPQAITRQLWLKWAKQLCSAIECIHSVGVIHHDIKPHNILLTESLDIRLADFGNACFTLPIQESPTRTLVESSSPGSKEQGKSPINSPISPSTPLSPITPSDTLLHNGLGRGTQAYSAPELLTISSSYSFPIDVYSMAVTLYTLIVGHEPFLSCPSSVYMLMAIRKGFFESGYQDYSADSFITESVYFLDKKECVEGTLKQWLLDCLLVNPNNRPSAASCMDLLESVY